MKNTNFWFLLFIITCGSPIHLNAQYQSIFGDNSTAWNIYRIGIGSYDTDSVYTSGLDTNFNGHFYKNVGGTLIREDTTTGSIFYSSYNVTNKEFEFMNMNLSVGDSFCYYPGFDTCYGNSYYTVDSVFTDSLGRKNIQFNFLIHYQDLPPILPLPYLKWKFIEGIGPNNRGANYHASGTLLCSYKDGVKVFTNEIEAPCFMTNVGLYENSLNQIKVYPNPANKILKIELLQPGQTIFKIIDITGKVYLKDELVNTKSVDVSLLPSGLYYIEFTNTKNTFYAKIIKQ